MKLQALIFGTVAVCCYGMYTTMVSSLTTLLTTIA